MAVRDERTEWLRVEMYRRMTPEERIDIAARMFEESLEIVRGSIRDRQPDISPEELECEVRRRVLGSALAELGRCKKN